MSQRVPLKRVRVRYMFLLKRKLGTNEGMFEGIYFERLGMCVYMCFFVVQIPNGFQCVPRKDDPEAPEEPLEKVDLANFLNVD